jgi:zinc transporter ZupT
MSGLAYTALLLSPIAGALIALFVYKKLQIKSINWALLFSGAFLLGIVVVELLPELFKANTPLLGIWLLAGFVLQVLLELLSKGKEHGHFHSHDVNKMSIYSITLGLFLHALIEGLPLSYYANEFHHHHLIHLPFIYAIIFHKLFVGLALALFLIQIKSRRFLVISIIILFAIMGPLGVILGEHIFLTPDTQNIILAIVAGSLLHIATIILYEQEEGHHHGFSLKKMLILALGFLTACLVLL